MCNAGRYSILSRNNLLTNCLHNSSKKLNAVCDLSLNDNSKIFGVTHIGLLKVSFYIIPAFHLPSNSNSTLIDDRPPVHPHLLIQPCIHLA